MASEHSYQITLHNNRTEQEAVDYLLGRETQLWIPDSASRKQILELLEIPRSLARAFDLVRVDVPFSGGGMLLETADHVSLVELKTTKKRLPELPKGFFFGATQNEFDLARALGDRYQFCFVCLHPDTIGHVFLTIDELEPLIRTKRTQYQINL